LPTDISQLPTVAIVEETADPDPEEPEEQEQEEEEELPRAVKSYQFTFVSSLKHTSLPCLQPPSS
jgi:hypothetical protein